MHQTDTDYCRLHKLRKKTVTEYHLVSQQLQLRIATVLGRQVGGIGNRLQQQSIMQRMVTCTLLPKNSPQRVSHRPSVNTAYCGGFELQNPI
jgi:hypothetical protein